MLPLRAAGCDNWRMSWIAGIVVSLLGLWMVWRQPRPWWLRYPATLILAGIGVFCGLMMAGMKLEMSGTGMPSFAVFESPEEHFQKVEEARKEDPPAAVRTPEVVQAAAPEQASAAATSSVTPAAAVWPDYRGAARDGVVKEKILTAWPGGKLQEMWRKPVGLGWGSFVVAGNVAYTIEQRRKHESVTAYDLSTGRELWAHTYDADFQESMGGPGPRATPTYHEGKIYSMGAEGDLHVLDAATGKTVWHKNILADNGADNITWAMSASPLIVDDTVVVQPGGAGGKSIVAYNKNTGARVWGALNDKAGYASPMLVQLAGRRQLVTVTAIRMVGLDPANGKLLWEYPWTTEYDINSAQPIIVGPAQVVVSSGYGHGAALVDVSSGAAKEVWFNKKLKNKFNSSVFKDGYIYGFDEAIFTCIEARTGEAKWKGGRYGYGQVLLAGDHLVITSEQGEVVLLKATPNGHEEVAKFQALDGRTWNVPVIANGKLLVRNAREMACYRIGA
jgi:outer membrane protein assembly factor BamB